MPDLTYPFQLDPTITRHRGMFDRQATDYDDRIGELLQQNEVTFRRRLVRLLDLTTCDRVLEVGLGTGANVAQLHEAASGLSLLGLDISSAMIAEAARRLPSDGVELCVANGEYLPLPDESFDAVLHFGFINEFPDPARALAEFARVLRPGRRAVVSDDGIVPAMRALPWARELIRQNPSFGADPPLAALPAECSVGLEWFAGVFYILTLTKVAR